MRWKGRRLNGERGGEKKKGKGMRVRVEVRENKTNLLCHCTATPNTTSTAKCKWTTTTIYLDQTSYNTEGGAQPKENKNEWCMRKKIEWTNEEGVNRDNFVEFLKNVGCRRIMNGIWRKSLKLEALLLNFISHFSCPFLTYLYELYIFVCITLVYLQQRYIYTKLYYLYNTFI